MLTTHVRYSRSHVRGNATWLKRNYSNSLVSFFTPSSVWTCGPRNNGNPNISYALWYKFGRWVVCLYCFRYFTKSHTGRKRRKDCILVVKRLPPMPMRINVRQLSLPQLRLSSHPRLNSRPTELYNADFIIDTWGHQIKKNLVEAKAAHNTCYKNDEIKLELLTWFTANKIHRTPHEA